MCVCAHAHVVQVDDCGAVARTVCTTILRSTSIPLQLYTAYHGYWQQDVLSVLVALFDQPEGTHGQSGTCGDADELHHEGTCDRRAPSSRVGVTKGQHVSMRVLRVRARAGKPNERKPN